MDSDLMSSVIDEISLEGLDGITVDSLWIRLNVRFASIPNSLDFESVFVQNFVFENVVKSEAINKTFSMYLLPEKRAKLKLYNRYDYINQETGTLIEDPLIIPEDIYGEVVPISDQQIRGSSNDYFQRIDVTKQVLDNNMSINDISVEFCLEKFVIVANQWHRNKALMGTISDPLIELTPIQYCILERIGRQRFLGEITVGKESGKYKSTPKTLFYYRKVLFRNKLIKKKKCIVFNARSVQNNHGLIFTLNRFFVERLTPMEMNAKRIDELLNESPDHELDYEELRIKLDLKAKQFKELLANYSINFKVCETKGEKNDLNRKSVKLIKSIEEEDMNEGIDDGEDAEEEDDEEVIETNNCQSLSKKKFVFNPGKILVDRPLLSQALAVIESHESQEGMSLKEIGRRLSLPKLETRSLVRYLEKLGDISTVMVDRGRQKVTMYLPKCRINETKSMFSRARKSLAINENDTVGHLNRANIILDFVNKVKLVDRIFTLKQKIRESETNNLHKVDTKSVVRIVHKLAADGHVRSIRTILKYQEQVKKLHFVCIPSITPDHPLVKEKINQFKFQWIGKYCIDIQSDKQLNKQKIAPNSENTSNSDSFERNNLVMNLIYMPSIARKYGLEPKLKKILTLYRYLFYLTYDFNKDNIPNTDWRFNIEPLPDGPKANVCTIGEIIPRMPLSIFVKIVWISYVIPGLQELLDDPIAKNLTLSQISPSIRQCLIYKRKFAFNICEGLVALSYLGLVESKHKEQLPKETTIITVKNKTSLMNNNKTINYEFKTLNDFENFAEALQYHCFEPCSNCSLDPRLFAHNLRNWTYTPSYKLKNVLTTQRLHKLSGNSNPLENNENKKTNNNKRKRNSSSTLNSKKVCQKKDNSSKQLANERKAGVSTENNQKEKVSVNISNIKNSINKKRKIRTKSCDTIDMKAKRLLKKQRTDWTQEEDAFLLVCKVASALLDPHCPHYICVNRNVVRDQLHKYSPNISSDKTALACQRRITYMLKNPNTRQNISDCIGEFKQEMKALNITRPNVPKTHEEVWNEAFVSLLNLILNRMQSPYLNNGTDTAIRVNSIEDLLSRYKIVKSSTTLLPVRGPIHDDPHNVVDIHVNAVTNILLSSLLSKYYLNSNNKNANQYFAQTLFKIYQRYPDSLIRSVVAKLGKYGIMTKSKKNLDLNSLKSKGNTPYKISQNFIFMLQTKFNLENLLTANNLKDQICIEEGKTSFETAIVCCLFSSKSVKFETQIPENIVMLYENSALSSTVRNSGKNPYDPKCSSRYALHVLRQHINSMPSDRTQHSQDYLFVNQCKVNSSATNPFLFNKCQFEQAFNKQKTLINPELKSPEIQFSTNDEKLLKYIMTKRELGATFDDIKVQYNGVWPKESLELFYDLRLVYRVGIRTFRWVYVDFLNPWLVHSPLDIEINRSNSNKNETNVNFVKFIARYWKRPDGSIDNKVLFKFLSGVLGYIMTYPFSSEQKIIEYFNQSLQPVQLLEIIELLRAADCVQMIESPQVSKPLLFEFKNNYSFNSIKYYYSTPDCLIYLCRLKDYLKV